MAHAGMVGSDFCYGAKRAGNLETLLAAGERHGFAVKVMPTITNNGQRISSSAIRTAPAEADLAQVARLLGHPFRMSGHVIHAKKLGRTIGFPTLN